MDMLPRTPQINECAVCFGEYLDDLLPDTAPIRNWVQCTSEKVWEMAEWRLHFPDFVSVAIVLYEYFN